MDFPGQHIICNLWSHSTLPQKNFKNYIVLAASKIKFIIFFFQKDHWWLLRHLGANLPRYPQFSIVLGPMDGGNAHHVNNNPWGEHILNSDPDAQSPFEVKKHRIKWNAHCKIILKQRWCVYVKYICNFHMPTTIYVLGIFEFLDKAKMQHQMENVGSTPTVLLDSLLLLSRIKYQVFYFMDVSWPCVGLGAKKPSRIC